MKYQKELKEVFDKFKDDYEILFVSLYGSQNYGLDLYNEDYQSDFDYKMVVFPSLMEVIKGLRTKKVETFKGGQVEIKDIKTFGSIATKLNPAYLESLFNENIYVNPDYTTEFYILRDLLYNLFEISGKEFVSACLGMSLEKQKALTHPYPTIKHKIDKWGFDGKQLHHQERLRFLAIDYVKTKRYKMKIENQYLIDYLLKLKKNEISLADAISLSEKSIVLLRQVRDEQPNSDQVERERIKLQIEEHINDAIHFSVHLKIMS